MRKEFHLDDAVGILSVQFADRKEILIEPLQVLLARHDKVRRAPLTRLQVAQRRLRVHVELVRVPEAVEEEAEARAESEDRQHLRDGVGLEWQVGSEGGGGGGSRHRGGRSRRDRGEGLLRLVDEAVPEFGNAVQALAEGSAALVD